MIVKSGTKTEYEAYARRLEHIIDIEAAKPSAERDDALIEECMETALYCRGMASQSRDAEPSMGRRWIKAVAVFAILLAAVLVISVIRPSRVSEASDGPLKWSADVYWEKDHLELRYEPDYSADYVYHTADVNHTADPEQPEDTSHVVPRTYYESEQALKDRFGDRILLPEMPEGYRLRKAFCFEDNGIVDSYLTYGIGMSEVKIKGTFSESGEKIVYGATLEFNDRFIDVYEKQINGATCIFGIGKKRGCIVVFTMEEGDLYSITGIRSIKVLEEIVYSMTKGVEDVQP